MNDMRSVPEPSSVGGRDPWAGFAAGPSSGSYPSSGPVFGNGSDTLGDDRAAADLARRLQDRIDGQEALLDRVALLAQLSDDRARIAELRDISRRLRRDSEALLLLCGADPGVHRGAPHTVPAVLGDAVGLADEPSRVSVTAAPSATLASTAAVELRHLVAELVDEAAAASPGARVEVDARLAPDGALLVDVVVAGRGWTDALGGSRAGTGATSRIAERIARRSTGGIRLERPLIDHREGVVATVACPAELVTGHTGGDPWHLPGSPFGGTSFGAADPGFADESPLMTAAMTSAHDLGGPDVDPALRVVRAERSAQWRRRTVRPAADVGGCGRHADLRGGRVGLVPRRRGRAQPRRLRLGGRPRVARCGRACHAHRRPVDHRQRSAPAQPGRPARPAAASLPPGRAAGRTRARTGPRPAGDLPAGPAAGPSPGRGRVVRRGPGGVVRRRLVGAVRPPYGPGTSRGGHRGSAAAAPGCTAGSPGRRR